MRQTFTSGQLIKLEERFQQTMYPNPLERHELATMLDLPETTVKVWFQNRRMKRKRSYWKAQNYAARTCYNTAFPNPFCLSYGQDEGKSYYEKAKSQYYPSLEMAPHSQRQHEMVACSSANSQRHQHQTIFPSIKDDQRTFFPFYYSHNLINRWNRQWGHHPPNEYRSSLPQTNIGRVNESRIENSGSLEQQRLHSTLTNQESLPIVEQTREEALHGGSAELRRQTANDKQVGISRLCPIVVD